MFADLSATVELIVSLRDGSRLVLSSQTGTRVHLLVVLPHLFLEARHLGLDVFCGRSGFDGFAW